MSDLVNLIPLSPQIWVFLGIDFAIAILLLVALRWMSGRLAAVSSTEELSAHDNFAFGISVAGRMFALCIVIAGAVQSSSGGDYESSAMSVLFYGVIGILLIKIGRVWHDKVILNQLDKEHHIRQRNTSIALVDAASSISTALIIRSVLLWVEGSDGNALVAIISGFVVTQTILLMLTRVFERQFARKSQCGTLQHALTEGQLALAIQHAGHLLGTAIVVTASGNMLIYKPEAYVSNLTSWLIVGMALAVLLSILVMIAKKLILAGLDLETEIDRQHNVGVASIEMVLHVGMALIVTGLLALTQ